MRLATLVKSEENEAQWAGGYVARRGKCELMHLPQAELCAGNEASRKSCACTSAGRSHGHASTQCKRLCPHGRERAACRYRVLSKNIGAVSCNGPTCPRCVRPADTNKTRARRSLSRPARLQSRIIFVALGQYGSSGILSEIGSLAPFSWGRGAHVAVAHQSPGRQCRQPASRRLPNQIMAILPH